jgi:hypothetical protein
MLIELRYYSPTDYNIWHRGLVEANSYDEATDKLIAKGIPLRIGAEPISFKVVKDPMKHDWGKGFSYNVDINRRIA